MQLCHNPFPSIRRELSLNLFWVNKKSQLISRPVNQYQDQSINIKTSQSKSRPVNQYQDQPINIKISLIKITYFSPKQFIYNVIGSCYIDKLPIKTRSVPGDFVDSIACLLNYTHYKRFFGLHRTTVKLYSLQEIFVDSIAWLLNYTHYKRFCGLHRLTVKLY